MISDEKLAAIISALPYYSPAENFSARVLAELGLSRERRLALAFEKTAVLSAVSWTAALAFAAALFAAAHIGGILKAILMPKIALIHVKFFALKFLMAAKAFLDFLAGAAGMIARPVLRPEFAVECALAALLASAAIAVISKDGRAARPLHR